MVQYRVDLSSPSIEMLLFDVCSISLSRSASVISKLNIDDHQERQALPA
jgi:hypothetical protein